MTPDTNNPPPVQPVQPPVAAQAAKPAPGAGDLAGWRNLIRSGALSASDEPHALNASAAPPAPAPAPVAAAKTMPLDDYLLLSGMLRISQQHARAWGLYDEQGNPIYPAGVLSHPFQTDKLPATADAPALLRASLVQPAPVAADDELDALVTLVRAMVGVANDTVRVVQLNPAVIRRVGEMVERLVARCRQQPAPQPAPAPDWLGPVTDAEWRRWASPQDAKNIESLRDRSMTRACLNALLAARKEAINAR